MRTAGGGVVASAAAIVVLAASLLATQGGMSRASSRIAAQETTEAQPTEGASPEEPTVEATPEPEVTAEPQPTDSETAEATSTAQVTPEPDITLTETLEPLPTDEVPGSPTPEIEATPPLEPTAPPEEPTVELDPGQGLLRQAEGSDDFTACASSRTGSGPSVGTVEVRYDDATQTLHYTLSLEGASPNATYLVDVAECDPTTGELQARGDGGHFSTDSEGRGELQGSLPLRTEAQQIRLTLVSFCEGEQEGSAQIPCDAPGFSVDALIPANR